MKAVARQAAEPYHAVGADDLIALSGDPSMDLAKGVANAITYEGSLAHDAKLEGGGP